MGQRVLRCREKKVAECSERIHRVGLCQEVGIQTWWRLLDKTTRLIGIRESHCAARLRTISLSPNPIQRTAGLPFRSRFARQADRCERPYASDWLRGSGRRLEYCLRDC